MSPYTPPKASSARKTLLTGRALDVFRTMMERRVSERDAREFSELQADSKRDRLRVKKACARAQCCDSQDDISYDCDSDSIKVNIAAMFRLFFRKCRSTME